MAHVSRTELRKGKLTKEEIKKIIKEDEKPHQLDLFRSRDQGKLKDQ